MFSAVEAFGFNDFEYFRLYRRSLALMKSQPHLRWDLEFASSVAKVLPVSPMRK
ncbi:hypothetical protein ARMGADRAFT_1021691 [Armillaria gallica]|uniref:Uncharacterized protein n=1 Tax=Armillaria gallica TaxID=47427 RepID=A0A2H3CV45_ARMGA|nr:hypothetical protein ARMGADRAFT_1021710 [Armillaria gallica]PBK79166.1 hypothetical protein ARMGADRAFT_1021691 [Armillaria gallica]